MKTVTKSELSRRTVAETALSAAGGEKFLDRLGVVIAAALREGETVILPGVGRISAAPRAARQGRNPRTGLPVEVPAKTVVKLRPAAALLEALNDDA